MPLLTVVLDACVLFPAALRDTLLRAGEADLYLVRWSEQILEEVRRNLVASGRMSDRRAERLIAAMRRNFPEAAVTGFESLTETMTNDERDRHVLAAAVVAGAQVIVTHNVRDFPRQALEPFHIEAQSPDRFLMDLLIAWPEEMVGIVAQQAADLQAPAMTVGQVVDELVVHAPRFAALVRSAIGDGNVGGVTE